MGGSVAPLGPQGVFRRLGRLRRFVLSGALLLLRGSGALLHALARHPALRELLHAAGQLRALAPQRVRLGGLRGERVRQALLLLSLVQHGEVGLGVFRDAVGHGLPLLGRVGRRGGRGVERRFDDHAAGEGGGADRGAGQRERGGG